MTKTSHLSASGDEALRSDDEAEVLRRLVEGTVSATGKEFFQSLVHNLSMALGWAYAFIAEFTDVPARVRTLAFWGRGQLLDNVEYDLAGTPCEAVARGELCQYFGGVQQLFPEDRPLADMGVESYIGVPLMSAGGSVLGHMAVLDTRATAEEPRRLSIFKIFAARAGAELERLLAEQERNRLHQQNLYLQEEIKSEYNFEEIIGSSQALRATLASLKQVAPTDSTVLILGETGTGKELIARAIHNVSKRKDKPLIKVNCAALTPGLIESELFGHETGAFTGALEKRVGRFALADGGTIFLDEIGEISPDVQVRLLRVLQEHEFEPVGSSKTIKVDVRVITATNRDLHKAVADGAFRADLFYRLNVFPVHVPPLRERRDDVPLLAHYFLEKYAMKVGKHLESVGRATMEQLLTYSWPGNVRELENVVERAVILSPGPALEVDARVLRAPGAEHATPHVAHNAAFASAVAASAVAPRFAQPGAAGAGASRSAVDDELGGATLAESQRRHIVRTLGRCNWVVEGPHGAAKSLGLQPSTLRSRMKKLGIRRSVVAS